MGSRCYYCGEKFGRCAEHAGNCPPGCNFGSHDCPGNGWDEDDGSDGHDLVREVAGVPITEPDVDW